MGWGWDKVGDAMLSAFFGVLFERLADPLLGVFFGERNVDQTLLDKLNAVLLSVNAVLSDAEEKQITNMAVKKWVDELKDATYHADDLLDEIATIALQCELEVEAKVNGNQVWSRFFSQNLSSQDSEARVKLDKDIESRLKKIVERLDLLANQRHLNLMESVRGKPPPILPSTSLVDESEVFGRDKDKKKLIELLLDDNSQGNGISVIAIVGIGGIGKTTLAQLVYNDPRVTTIFKARAWAHVSEEFDVFKVTKTIFESVTSGNCYYTDLNVLQVKLEKVLKRKRFLIVLDDLWNEKILFWDLLLKPFKAGVSQNRIIVTTRNQSVASIMHAFVPYALPLLLQEDCWLLFAKHAFNTRNPEEHPTLKRIGEEIVRKCAGLPLAAKTLGALLSSTIEVEDWHRILKHKIWDIPNDKSGIFPALRLSYNHLHPHLKQCFSYCSIFPKGHQFEKEKLIRMWMAEGFLLEPKGHTMEEIGNEYFRQLLSRSFFQQSRLNDSFFEMHDLVHDLAQFASGEFCCKFEDSKQQGLPKKARHFACSMDQLDGPEKLQALPELNSLRTFLALSSSTPSQCSPLSKIFTDVWLLNMKHLRVLSFPCPALTHLHANSLGKLIHLRYLDLSDTLISELPKSTCSLYNLQTLLLSSCTKLTELPSNIGNLINLHHLDVSETKLREMPPGFGRLQSLQLLTDFVVGKDNGSKISELGKLLHLRSTLSISKLENVVDATNASEANLKGKNYLNELIFKWTSDTHNIQNETEVLDCLLPHENLKKLTIENFGGTRFPQWLGDPIFCNMVILRLKKCKHCTSLPPLGQLSSLESLFITDMEVLETLDSQFYGIGHYGVQPFRSLKTLMFEGLPRWTSWIPFANDDEGFPSLQELQIRHCPELTGILPKRPSSTELVVSGCSKLQAFIGHDEEQATHMVPPQ